MTEQRRFETERVRDMRITSDAGLCQSYGNCLAVDPEHFDLDDEGLVAVLRATVTDDEQPTVAAAVRSCPVAAIAMVDDDA
jgi:ferredoxin